MVALNQIFVAELLSLGQHSLALADPDSRRTGFGVDPLDCGGDDLAELALKFKQGLILFAGADTLTDNASCRRNRDPAELLWIERNLDLLAELDPFALCHLFGVGKTDLKVGREHLVNNGLYQLYVKKIFVRVDFKNNVLVALFGRSRLLCVVLACRFCIIFAGGNDRLLNLLKHIVHRNVFFFFKHSQSFKKFFVRHFPIILF